MFDVAGVSTAQNSAKAQPNEKGNMSDAQYVARRYGVLQKS